jgi:6-phosphogluconolactonase
MTRRVAIGVVLGCLAGSVAARPQPSGRLVFVGSYTGAASKGISAFRFDDRTGTLTPVGLAAETRNPSFLTASADGRFLFAVNEYAMSNGDRTGAVTSFAIDRATGMLTKLSEQPSRGSDPCHLMLDRTGRYLAVANYTSGTFAVFPVGTDGRLGPAGTVFTNEGSGPNRARQAGPHAHDVLFDARNRFLLGADLGLDRVFVYRFDAATGRVTPNDPPSGSVAPGAGPRHLAFHPNGRFLFAIDELASTITSFTWDGERGRLGRLGSVSTLPADFHGQSATAEIAVHPNGRFLYGSNRGHDSIAVFDIAANGSLTPVEFQPTRGRTPRHFTLDPAGRWLIAANQDSNSLAIFAVDQTTGKLTPSGPLVSSGAPVCVLFLAGE